ncbi:phage tail spike protein [Enterococcus rivorum]|uniref:phage tail spike protein n=1 Tax=Enterococcus rivorum TaxID=762845 RepID=UPI00362CBB0C
MGKYSNQRFTYGDKALSIVKEQDRNQVYTSLIGRGRGEDVGDGKGNRIEFDKVEWKKSKGKPLDKPKGQNWLEIPEMTKQYGIPLSNGDMRRREKVIIFDDEEDAEKLLQKTYQALIDYSRPLVQFKTEILDGDIIGNTVTIHRHDRKYHYETRIFKVKIDRLTGKIESSLGDNITNNIVKVASDLKGNVASLEEKKTTFYDSEEISKWQDDVLRGAKGGSIRIMNGIETEKSDSREPYQMVFMNGITVEKSKHFLIMNSSGISFVKGNLNNKPETAWTIDGELNADFIKGGTLEGVNVRTSSERDSQIRLQSNGTIVVYNKNKAEEMFWMGSAGNHSVVGLTHIEGYGFQIGTATNKEDRANNAIFEIPKEAKGSNKLYKLYGNGTLKGDIKIEGRLFLNGKEVIHGQGGGSGGGNTGGGTYPPDLTTDAEKRAWDIWAFLLANGYSKQATAGILGNIQGEVGSSMNPDTGQNGGPAYGLVQWDGSSYPLVGSQTTNGREYVQRLMAAARISEDYTTLSAQLKLISWCMYNGQWIGAVNPTSVEGFKVCNDIYTATFAFLKTSNVLELNDYKSG